MEFFNAAAYIRLSREDGDKLESNSISNQRDFINNSVERNMTNVNIIDYYIDDGFTGTNFNRPDFQRMLKDIERGIINCVIVKDLSRIGRNYIDTGTYLERYFPQHGVRFIALNDGIDNYQQSYDISMPIKNIVNAQYARDISSKVITAIRTKQQNGEFIGGFAPYGYMKDPNNKNHLIIDHYAAAVVQRIFNMYVEGYGQIGIAKTLTAEGIPCPSVYKKSQGLKYTNGQKLEITKYWTYSTIHNILKNEVYIGNMVQHKLNSSQYRVKKSKQVSKDEWIIVKDTHEPIISYDIFNTVQSMMKKSYRSLPFSKQHSLANHIQCADCGRGMCRVVQRGISYFRCGTYQKYGNHICTSHLIRQDAVEKIVIDEINRFISEVKNIEKVISKPNKKNKKVHSNIHKQIKALEEKIDRNKLLRKSLYEDYKGQILTCEEYIEYKKQYEDEIINLNNQLKVLNEKVNKTCQDVIEEDWFAKFLKYKQIDKLTPEVVSIFINMIYVYTNKVIKIVFNFQEDLDELKKCIS